MNGHKNTNQNAIHFITPTIVGWIDIFTRKVYKDFIIDGLKYCIANKGLSIHSYVIMSNHLHLMVSAKEGFKLSNIIRDFQSHTAQEMIKYIVQSPKESRQAWILNLLKYHAKHNSSNAQYQIWQKGNHPIELATPKWIKTRFDYIHLNPVRVGLVEAAEDYTYSSAKDYILLEDGLLPIHKIDADYFYA